MGTLLLCKDTIAPSPYYIEEVSLNVYTLEELSYFIVNNEYLLNASFMSIDMCNWIMRELGLKELASELLDLIKNAAPLHIFVGKILEYCGYLTVKEQKDVIDLISTFENKSETECQKLRADKLMEKEKYVDAIYEYESIVAGNTKVVASQLIGDVYHNLGCAYSRLFFFEKAIACFDEAYKRNHKRASLICLLGACKCSRDADKFNSMAMKYQVLKEDVDAISKTISTLSLHDEIVDFDEKILGETASAKEVMDSYLNGVLNDWKSTYTKYCKI